MPEMPDLELFSGNLQARLRGKKVTAVRAGKKGRVRSAFPRLSKSLTGHTLRRAARDGKEIRFEFSGDVSLNVHLMLAGGFAVEPADVPVKHAVLTVEFGSRALTVFDPRGLASVRLNAPVSTVRDALEADAAYLKECFAKAPNVPAKAFLIDQARLRGIGNAYADEILWKARISPKSRVGKIPPARVTALARAIPSVLKAAVRSLRRLRREALSGEDRSFLAVHNPRRETSPAGRPIRVETVAGKKTYYTDEQALYA